MHQKWEIHPKTAGVKPQPCVSKHAAFCKEWWQTAFCIQWAVVLKKDTNKWEQQWGKGEKHHAMMVTPGLRGRGAIKRPWWDWRFSWWTSQMCLFLDLLCNFIYLRDATVIHEAVNPSWSKIWCSQRTHMCLGASRRKYFQFWIASAIAVLGFAALKAISVINCH